MRTLTRLEHVNKRYQTARDYFAWFNPAWHKLASEEQWLLDACYRTPGQSVGKGMLQVMEHFYLAKSTAYNKKNQALDHLTLLLYGSHH